jgi:dTDP-4-dehydrorhamnose reductase
MKIGIIGSDGLLGRSLCSGLNVLGNIIGINRHNYSERAGEYDIIVNANGNSRKYFANSNPFIDFDMSVSTVYKSMFDFKASLYVYISTSDVYNHSFGHLQSETSCINNAPLSVYGFNKLLSEEIVKKHSKNYLILRCAALLGSTLSKGVIFDVLNKAPLFVSKSSYIQFISVYEVSNIIKMFVYNGIINDVFNVGGRGSTSIAHIEQMAGYPLVFSDECENQYIEMCVDKLGKLFLLNKSDFYVEEALYERMGKSV